MKDRRLVQRFWDGITPVQLLPLAGAVFCLFGAVGFIVDVGQPGRFGLGRTAALVALSGGLAVAYLLVALRRRYWLFALLIPLHLVLTEALRRFPPLAPGQAMAADDRLLVDVAGAVAALAIGYSLFMVFISREGIRRVRAQAEIELAREIHLSLVPPVTLRLPGCELHGRSLPATEVGGDLVDALAARGRPLGFVADVSGHGVPAGALMGVLKAGLRTRLRAAGGLDEVMTDLNEVLVELTRPHTFATAALVALETPGGLCYVLAGHPPILLWHRAGGSVTQLGEGGLALGIRSGERYRVGRAEVAPGDVLAVLTDGFMETMDRGDAELGLGPLGHALAAHGDEPLPELFERLLAVALGHGEQHDDRTLLLLRVLPA